MNRKQKRELRKDKNLITELYTIIIKYLPELFEKFQKLTDTRHQGYVTYSMKCICVTRLFGLLCGITSMTEITDKFNSEESIENISSIINENLYELPYWETIQDVMIKIDLEELRKIQKYIVVTLLRSKMFDRYKYENCFQLLFDGTGLSNHDYNLNDNCLTREHKSGKITYHKYVLECKLVVGSIVVSLDSEFIENNEINNENQKQDCETKAFKRMIKRIKKNYPKYQFIITGDALYATDPIIKICQKYNWKYIFNLKPDRLKEINETFEDNLKYENETTVKHYFLSCNIEYKKNYLNAIRYDEPITNNVFRYLTNLPSNNNTVKDIVYIGRKRWKIENEGFNVQKNGTFNISHVASRDKNGIKVHYFFIQFAHTIRQLLEKGNLNLKMLKYKIKEVSYSLQRTLTSSTIDLCQTNLSFQLRFDE